MASEPSSRQPSHPRRIASTWVWLLILLGLAAIIGFIVFGLQYYLVRVPAVTTSDQSVEIFKQKIDRIDRQTQTLEAQRRKLRASLEFQQRSAMDNENSKELVRVYSELLQGIDERLHDLAEDRAYYVEVWQKAKELARER